MVLLDLGIISINSNIKTQNSMAYIFGFKYCNSWHLLNDKVNDDNLVIKFTMTLSHISFYKTGIFTRKFT